MIVLDTHVLVWLSTGDAGLGRKADDTLLAWRDGLKTCDARA